MKRGRSVCMIISQEDKNIAVKQAVCDENIVYILGAGFSAYAGLPVMSNFLTKSKDIYFENPEKYKYFEDLFKEFDKMTKIKNYFTSNLFNIEEILSVLEMNVAVGGETKTRDNFKTYIKDVIKYYNFDKDDFRLYKDRDLGSLDEKPFSSKNDVINRYGYFVASLLHTKLFNMKETYYIQGELQSSKDHYSIITFNYDMIIEQIKKHIEFFTGKIEDGILDIYKLHGSVDGDIISPTWAKSITPEMKSIWSGAFLKLQDATQIRIIGYSLPITDSYFRYFLKSALLENNRLKKIDIICYDANGSVSKNYLEFIDSQFPNFRFVNKKIDDYLFDLKNATVKNRRDFLSFDKLEEVHEKFMTVKTDDERLFNF